MVRSSQVVFEEFQRTAGRSKIWFSGVKCVMFVKNRSMTNGRLLVCAFLCFLCVYAAGQDFSPIFPEPITSDFQLENAPLGFDGESVGGDWSRKAFLNGGVLSRHGHNDHVDVPEPLLFDLVRPLGAKKGEVEFNTLAVFPWRATNTNLQDDPFGPGPTTPDRKGIEWAPEVEIALADNFAIEFEFPFESTTLEEYKLGLQWTIGTAFNHRYIHGFQALIEPTVEWEKWSTTLLYLGGIRFDETWSALFMVGGRINLEGPNRAETFERLTNSSIFADVADGVQVGVETNYASKLDGTSNFILIPQLHYQLTERFQTQSGLGFGTFTEGSEQSFIIRVIYSR
jgi:hypothetical protein